MTKKVSDKTILIIEDEIPLQKAIKAKLEKCGLQSVTARSVKQAIDFLESLEKVDAVWLDHYLLGKETGLDLVSKIKNNEKWSKIPIFVVSNTATPDKINFYIELGVENYFTKSEFRLDNIIEKIKKKLKLD